MSKWRPLLDKKGSIVYGFRVYEKTGVIHMRREFKKLGIPALEASTGETTLLRAKARAEALEQEWIRKHLVIRASQIVGESRHQITFGDVARHVLQTYTPTQRARTREKHWHHIPRLITAFGEMDVNAVVQDTFDTWVRAQHAAKPTRTSFEDEAKHMNIIFRIAYQNKAATHLLRFKSHVRAPKKRFRILSESEIAGLWEVMTELLRDIFVLSYECFMRLREALFLSWDRIDLETGMITLRAIDVKTGSKTGKGRTFFLSPHALSRMRRRYEERDVRSPWVFPSPRDRKKPQFTQRQAWDKAKTKAKISGECRWHDLRHTALSRALLERRANITKVSEYSGVSVRELQKTYLHSTPEHTSEVASLLSVFGGAGNAPGTALNEEGANR